MFSTPKTARRLHASRQPNGLEVLRFEGRFGQRHHAARAEATHCDRQLARERRARVRPEPPGYARLKCSMRQRMSISLTSDRPLLRAADELTHASADPAARAAPPQRSSRSSRRPGAAAEILALTTLRIARSSVNRRRCVDSRGDPDRPRLLPLRAFNARKGLDGASRGGLETRLFTDVVTPPVRINGPASPGAADRLRSAADRLCASGRSPKPACSTRRLQ